MANQAQAIAKAQILLRTAKRVAVLTGAGISAESGIPTFRGAGGLWREYRPEQLATPEAFARDPDLVTEWYNWRRSLIAQAQPNAGHRALVDLENRVEKFTLVTQNVDGLHQRAGSRRVLAVHGDIRRDRCERCLQEIKTDQAVRFCGCGGRLRPAVVWFGEPLPPQVWDAAERAIRRAQVLVVAGTSAQVYPAAGLVPLARACGAAVIEVNVEATPATTSVDIALTGPCGKVLPEIVL